MSFEGIAVAGTLGAVCACAACASIIKGCCLGCKRRAINELQRRASRDYSMCPSSLCYDVMPCDLRNAQLEGELGACIGCCAGLFTVLGMLSYCASYACTGVCCLEHQIRSLDPAETPLAVAPQQQEMP